MSLPPWPQRGLHVIAKPIGPICNLRCAYCFYLGKESLYPAGESWRMSDETLDAYVRQYLDAQPPSVDEVDFAFQGGEPTLMGLDFFRRVVELQAVHARPGVRIHNSLQTNGVLLDDAWCEFLAQHRFLVGLSLDGPAEMHDRFRVDRAGEGTFERVMAAMRRLPRHGVEFNTLTCIHQHNANLPVRVYRFLRDQGSRFMQFIPIVEPMSQGGQSHFRGEDASRRGDVHRATKTGTVPNHSVLPVEFGRFLIEVFDEWFRRDVGRVFVRDFDAALGAWTDRGGSQCVHAEECGRALALEHNGDLYACDHFVDPEHRLGNIHETPIRELADAAEQRQFGRDKTARLPDDCRRCPYRFACQGGCPKDRTMTTLGGQPGLNSLCEGFRMFFGHVAGAMEAMAAEVRAGRPAANVAKRADAVGDAPGDDAGGPVRRNAPCPCGSGKKFKNCCMRRGA